MNRSPLRFATALALAVAALTAPAPLPMNSVEAAQPWYCVCNGQKKRYLASTRHCEHEMRLPKGQWCSKAQIRAVYEPACRKQGCRILPP